MQSTSPDLLAAGPLVLDLKTRVLTGPATSTELASSCFGTVRAFMRHAGQIVDTGTLIGELFLAGLEPKEAEVALRHRIMRVRQMLTKVGMPASCLRNVRGEGYVLDAPEKVVRTFTPAQADILDRLVATHPDQAAAAMITTSAGGA
jgi:DNA-binding response OmpR family regulator